MKRDLDPYNANDNSNISLTRGDTVLRFFQDRPPTAPRGSVASRPVFLASMTLEQTSCSIIGSRARVI